MNSWSAEIRRREAAQRREEREARKRQKDLERRLKEQWKLSEMEQARLEVEQYENTLEVLLSVHKEQSAPVDWARFASALPPHEPVRSSRHELAALLNRALAWSDPSAEGENTALEEARSLDQRAYDEARVDYEEELTQWQKMRLLARQIIAGQADTYYEAVKEFSVIGEISTLGSSVNVKVHGPKLIECQLQVNGRDVIPAEVKTLTAKGKVSVKAMPRARFHEIYQDYVCGCVLRLAREVFALLPVETVLVTAAVDRIDSSTGNAAELPVLSVVIHRADVERLDFQRLDPSDSLENFLHRGDVKASRKSEEFVPITPLALSDLSPPKPEGMNLISLLSSAREFRAEIAVMLKPANSESVEPLQSTLPPS